MSRKNHAEIVFILDRSGSMQSIQTDAIGGFNAFIESQKKVAGTADITLVLFDHEYQKVYDAKDINSVELLTDKTYIPRGNTALLDAIGRSINEAGAKLNALKEDERAEKVMVCILTDGAENASKEFTNQKIKEMIEHQRSKYNWEFAYLGANQDAFATASMYGITRGMTSNFIPDAGGTKMAYACLDTMATKYRSSN